MSKKKTGPVKIKSCDDIADLPDKFILVFIKKDKYRNLHNDDYNGREKPFIYYADYSLDFCTRVKSDWLLYTCVNSYSHGGVSIDVDKKSFLNYLEAYHIYHVDSVVTGLLMIDVDTAINYVIPDIIRIRKEGTALDGYFT